MTNRFVLLLLCAPLIVLSGKIKEEFTWSRVNYVWPTSSRYRHEHSMKNKNEGALVFPDEAPSLQDGNVPPNVDYIFGINLVLQKQLLNCNSKKTFKIF